jgi:aryl-alcohol dehydrogenase-like predicted oxidoreductase
MLAGRATDEGIARYAARFSPGVPDVHFRGLRGAGQISSVGIGTYLGREDAATDSLYRRAVAGAVERGVNVVDTAINYRHQRSERAVGAALADVVRRGPFARDELVVATKGGYIPFDAEMPADPRAYFLETYLKPGIISPDDVVGMHCMAPRYLEDQLERSRRNLGLATIDIYYIHNPEGQLEEIERPEFFRRIRAAFETLEAAVRAGKIGCYGTATWNGYRQPPDAPDYLALADLVAAAHDVGGADHHFRVIQLPYNLAMTEAFTRANQKVNGQVVTPLEAARRLDVYVMASASVYQGRLARDLPPVVADFLPGFSHDAQRALQFVRSTPGIGTALVGMKSMAHVDQNAAVVRAAPMPWEQFQRLFTQA